MTTATHGEQLRFVHLDILSLHFHHTHSKFLYYTTLFSRCEGQVDTNAVVQPWSPRKRKCSRDEVQQHACVHPCTGLERDAVAAAAAMARHPPSSASATGAFSPSAVAVG